jgi:hypothetical protein
MITKLFNTNPDERVGVEEIRNHPWYKLNNPETCSFNTKRTFDSINMKIVA